MTDVSKAVLITGCSTGIGHATALRLQRAGHKVYATARKPETLADLKSAGCTALALDVNDEPSMQSAVRFVEEREGAVGVLINNAGYSQSGALETLPLERVRAQFETNVFGLLRLSQLVLPGMRRQRYGRIVNVGSVAGKLTFPGGGAYHAAKHAVEALSDALRWEVAGFGVDVVLIQPGFIRTSFAEAAQREMVAARPGDAYARFNAAVEKATQEVYEKPPWSWFGGEADSVARAIERAITARRPKTRYKVTPSAHLLLASRALMTDRLWDLFLSTNLPAPK